MSVVLNAWLQLSSDWRHEGPAEKRQIHRLGSDKRRRCHDVEIRHLCGCCESPLRGRRDAPARDGDLIRLGGGLELMRFYHDNAEIRHGIDTREVDIGFQDRFICGNFVDEDRPTFLDMMHAHYEEILGDRYVPMPDEGGWLHE